MSQTALKEPAILIVIFRDLAPIDLLLLQRVCLSWRTTITTNKSLLSKIFLHPGVEPEYDRPPQLNPLLIREFPWFFRDCVVNDNRFTSGGQNHGPWLFNRHEKLSPQPLPRYKHSEASWRSMLPCCPPPTQLQIHVVDRTERDNRVVRLNFSNSDPHDYSKTHPAWLTFGFIHDLMENAWFHGSPWYIDFVRSDYTGIDHHDRRSSWPMPEFTQVSNELRKAVERPQQGRVRLHFLIDRRSSEERQRQRNRRRSIPERRRVLGVSLPRYPGTGRPSTPHLFTDEFHFEDSLSFSDIEWDEVQEYTLVPPPAPPAPRRPFDVRWGRIRRPKLFRAGLIPLVKYLVPQRK